MEKSGKQLVIWFRKSGLEDWSGRCQHRDGDFSPGEGGLLRETMKTETRRESRLGPRDTQHFRERLSGEEPPNAKTLLPVAAFCL